MLAQIPVALEELRQSASGGKHQGCDFCKQSHPIIFSIIETISGESGSLADGLKLPKSETRFTDYTRKGVIKAGVYGATLMSRPVDSLKVGEYVYGIAKGYDGRIAVIGTQSSAPERLSEDAAEVKAALAAENWDFFEGEYALAFLAILSPGLRKLAERVGQK